MIFIICLIVELSSIISFLSFLNDEVFKLLDFTVSVPGVGLNALLDSDFAKAL